MTSTSDPSNVFAPNPAIAEPAKIPDLPFYDSLQWEPLESPVETCAAEKIRLNAPDQPNLWAYLQHDTETSSSAEIDLKIEIYDDEHYDNPLSPDSFRDLKLLAPYKWICPGTGSLSNSVHNLKGFVLACFIVRGHEVAWRTMCDQEFYDALDHAVALIESGQYAEHEFAMIGATSLSQDPNTLPPPVSPPLSPLSSASDTSEPDRECLERALCLKYETSILSCMSTLVWVNNPDVPIGKRLRVGSRDGQPVFADFTPEAIATVQILIRQGEKLRTAKTVRKRDLDKVKWDVPFSYVVDDAVALGEGEELRNFLKGLFVLEGYSYGSRVLIDEKAFCETVNQIMEHTGTVAVDGTSSANSFSLRKGKTRTTPCRPSDIVTRQGSDQSGQDLEWSSGHSQSYKTDKSKERRSVQPLCSALAETEGLETAQNTETENKATYSKGFDKKSELLKDKIVEERAQNWEGVVYHEGAGSLDGSLDTLTSYAHTKNVLQFKINHREKLQNKVQAHAKRSKELEADIQDLDVEIVRKEEQRVAILALKQQKEGELIECNNEIRALKRQRGDQEGKTGHALYRALGGEAGSPRGLKRQK